MSKKEKSPEASKSLGTPITKLFFSKGLAEASIALLILLIYFSTFSYGYTRFEDTLIIEKNKTSISDISNIGKAFTTDARFIIILDIK